MVYERIELQNQDGEWIAYITQLKNIGKRGNPEFLNPFMGYLDYPKKWKRTKAFEILKTAMVQEYRNEIAELQKKLKALEEYKIED